MNPASALSLILLLWEQLTAAQRRIGELEADLAAREGDAPEGDEPGGAG